MVSEHRAGASSPPQGLGMWEHTMLLPGGLWGKPHFCVGVGGMGGSCWTLPSVVIKAEIGIDTKKETGEVAGLESVLFETGKERPGEKCTKECRDAWGSLDIVVHGQLWARGCTHDEQKSTSMVHLALGIFRPERQSRNGERCTDHLLPHHIGAHFLSIGLKCFKVFFFSGDLSPGVHQPSPALGC